jgi:hypothetical protein
MYLTEERNGEKQQDKSRISEIDHYWITQNSKLLVIIELLANWLTLQECYSKF